MTGHAARDSGPCSGRQGYGCNIRAQVSLLEVLLVALGEPRHPHSSSSPVVSPVHCNGHTGRLRTQSLAGDEHVALIGLKRCAFLVKNSSENCGVKKKPDLNGIVSESFPIIALIIIKRQKQTKLPYDFQNLSRQEAGS